MQDATDFIPDQGPPSAEPFAGVADGLDDIAEKLGGPGSVHHAMVARKRQSHHRTDAGAAVHGHDPFRDAPDGKNRGLRRGNDGAECVHPEHAEIADGEGAAGNVGRAQFAGAGPLRKIATLHRDFTEIGFVGVVNDRGDDAVVDGHGHAHVHVRVGADRIPGPTCIHPWMLRAVLARRVRPAGRCR